MSSLFIAVLPFALGAAVSPTLLTLEFLILAGGTHAKSRAWMFVLGAMMTILVIGAFAAGALRNVAAPTAGATNYWLVGGEAFIALALVVIGVRQLRPVKTLGERHQSRTQHLIAGAKTPIFFVVGVVAMITNLSTIVLYLPAVHLIVHSTEPASTKALAALMLWVITILPILLPVLAVTIVGHRSDALLSRVNGWTARHTRQINAGLCFFFALLIGYSAVKAYLA
ncbi:MAG: GAP family protein [Actinomycetales bacterium]|nr:GAP family protein [Actinomycetales bacterium]